MSAADCLPLFLRLRDRHCLVVGGGTVAARKIKALLDAGATVTVVAPALCPAVAALSDAKLIEVRERPFERSDIDVNLLIIAATNNPEVNRAVVAAATAAGRLANVVDDIALSSAFFPALIRRGGLTIAVSTGGAAPVLARLVRSQIERLLAPSLGELVALAARWRERVRTTLANPLARRQLWEQVMDERGEVRRALDRGQPLAAEEALEAALGAAENDCTAGFVSLVGAGPGDPELITLRALRALQSADVILHDRLVSPEVLALARRDAECEDVGKLTGADHAAAQAGIDARLVALARAGLRVVRLKGGDPFIFGRGAEELQALRQHGIAFEVIPGITAALGCAAYAGIALTQRELAQQVTLVTAHCARSLDKLDWPLLAKAGHTTVFYMGVAQASRIEQRLLAFGCAGETPVAIVERGTTAQQRVVHARLAGLGATVAAAHIEAPALIIVGEVAATDRAFAWFGEGEGSAQRTPTLGAAA